MMTCWACLALMWCVSLDTHVEPPSWPPLPAGLSDLKAGRDPCWVSHRCGLQHHSSLCRICSPRLGPLAHLLALIWVVSASPCSADTRPGGGSVCMCVWQVVIMMYACLLQGVHTT